MSVPILFIGDSPSLTSGLARIGRDLATGCSRLPQFRVAYMGRGGIADARLPFPQYTFAPTTSDQWGAAYLADVWRNHANGQRGIVFTCGWDLSRLTWFGVPQRLGGEYAAVSEFLVSAGASVGAPFDRWGYFAIDAEGPGEPESGRGGGLPPMLARTAAGYQRVLAYSRFGQHVLTESGIGGVEWAPHGVNTAAFQPRERGRARAEMAELFGRRFVADTRLCGTVMTNQPRKDFGLWADTARRLRHEYPEYDWRFWAHTDSLDLHWDLRMLVEAFALADVAVVTVDSPSDEQMSWRYSACDVTTLPSLGEGFGYPIVESLACGVPVVHGAYAGGAEYTFGMGALVKPSTYRYDTRWCMRRPVFEAEEWVNAIVDVVAYGPGRALPDSFGCSVVEHLAWKRLWPSVWEKWFLRGLAEGGFDGR